MDNHKEDTMKVNRSRVLRMTLLVVMLLLAGQGQPVAAAVPIRETFVFDPVTYTGVCTFDVRLDPLVNMLKLTTLVDKEGQARFQLMTGAFKVRVTNLSTGQFLDLNSAHAARIEVWPDGSQRITFGGRVIGILVPGQLPEFTPRLFLASGRTVADFS